MPSPRRLDERFTDLADGVSETVGRWQVSAILFGLLLLWLLLGPLFRWSDRWWLAADTPSNLIELGMGFVIAASANRIERRNARLQDEHRALLREHARLLDELVRRSRAESPGPAGHPVE